MKVRIYYRANGSVIIVHPSEKVRQIIFRPPHGKPDGIFLNTPEVRALIPAAEGEGYTIILEPEQDFMDRAGNIHVAATKGTLDRHGYSKDLTGLDYDDIDSTSLPDRATRDKWRGDKVTGLRVDMSVLTVADKRKTVEDMLDAELAKPAGNSLVAMRLQRKLDKRDY